MKLMIETNRLQIRNFLQRDAQDLYEILGDAETMQYSEPAYSFEKTEMFIEEFCIGQGGAFAAVHKQTDKVIGYLLFHRVAAGEYEIGWFFNRAYWRRGYAYEASKAIIEYGFDRWKAKRIFAQTIDAVKAVPLMKKLKMQFEGVQKGKIKDNQGNEADLYCYGLQKG